MVRLLASYVAIWYVYLALTQYSITCDDLLGGTNNAYTDSEKTVYYFDVDGSIDSRFGEALLRFGSFFSGPLFTESATGRELNAIDSENSKNLQNDIFRLYELSLIHI